MDNKFRGGFEKVAVNQKIVKRIFRNIDKIKGYESWGRYPLKTETKLRNLINKSSNNRELKGLNPRHKKIMKNFSATHGVQFDERSKHLPKTHSRWKRYVRKYIPKTHRSDLLHEISRFNL